MKLKRTATYHEFLADDGRRFVVRLAQGMAVALVETALGRERVEWRREWGVYRPLSESTAQRAVAEFCRRQGLQRPRINGHDRQLPAGDRA